MWWIRYATEEGESGSVFEYRDLHPAVAGSAFLGVIVGYRLLGTIPDHGYLLRIPGSQGYEHLCYHCCPFPRKTLTGCCSARKGCVAAYQDVMVRNARQDLGYALYLGLLSRLMVTPRSSLVTVTSFRPSVAASRT